MSLPPHGGKLVDRVLSTQEKAKVMSRLPELPKLTVSRETISELQNLARGVFSPLEGFLNRREILSVASEGHLTNGLPWTIPILLSADDESASAVREGQTIILVGEKQQPLAQLSVKEKFRLDKALVARGVFGTDDQKHPGVQALLGCPDTFLAGDIDLLEDIRSPYERYHLTPRETRYLFQQKGWDTVVAFQTRNPPHRAHEYIQKCALEVCDGLFINPVIGRKKSGDFTDDLILKSYQKLIDDFYPPDRVVMSILPWQMRYAGPKEAIFHAIVRKNFGCTHHIIGRDHAGVGAVSYTHLTLPTN